MAKVIQGEASASAGASTSTDSNQNKSKKPSNSAFKQQRLAAWQPILTAGTVLPTFFVIGVLFIPVGIGLWYFSDNVNEKIIDYTHCRNETYNDTCANVIEKYEKTNGSARNEPFPECICKLNFTLEKDFRGKVFIYYGLTNFYQNHRRYVKSRDDKQLYGGTDLPSGECSPYDKVVDENGKTRYVWPCGAIANSMFQDEISLYAYKSNGSAYQGTPIQVELNRTGIAWESDISYKFKNPPNWNTEKFKEENIKPKAWRKSPWDLDPANPKNNGLQNEDFIVWMRTAALPNFRKLYRIVNQEVPGYAKGVRNGDYMLQINYTYPVISFQGTKSVIISTTSLLGGKNPFLGISYVVVGSICLVLGIVFLFIHINFGKSTFEMTNVDPRTPY